MCECVYQRADCFISQFATRFIKWICCCCYFFRLCLRSSGWEGVGSVFFRRRSVSQQRHNIHTRALCFSVWGAIVLSFNRYRCFVVPAEAPSAAAAWVSDLADWELPVCQPTLPNLPLFACELQITAQQRQACSRQRQGFALSSAPCSRLWVLCHMTLAEIDPPPHLKEMLRHVEGFFFSFLFFFFFFTSHPASPSFCFTPTTHTLSQKTGREAVPGARWTEWQWPDRQDSSTFLDTWKFYTWKLHLVRYLAFWSHKTCLHKYIHLTNNNSYRFSCENWIYKLSLHIFASNFEHLTASKIHLANYLSCNKVFS